MAAMVKAGHVPAEKSSQVVEVACLVWPHHPDPSLEALKTVDTSPTPQIIANLLDSVTMDDEEQLSKLQTLWFVIAQRLNVEEQIETSEAILAKPTTGTSESPDHGLRTWLDQTGQNKPAVLEALMENETLNDEQHKRVWLQIEGTQDTLDKGFFSSVLPKVSGLSGNPETLSEVFDFEEPINRKFVSADDKYALGQVLIASFRASSSKEGMKRFAEWLEHLEVDGVIREISDPSPDEIEILKPHFSKSRHWKAFAKKVKE